MAENRRKIAADLDSGPTLQSDSGCSASLNLSLSASSVKSAGGFSAGVWVSR